MAHNKNGKKIIMDINKESLDNSGIVIYQDDSGNTRVDVKLHAETVWLSLSQLVSLFQRDKSVISRHIKNIFKEQELQENSVVAKFATTASDGKVYQIEYYNLDMIISVGYRVNSKKAVNFRRWASSVLKDYLIKGYSLNQRKLVTTGLEELKQTVLLLSNTIVNQSLVNDMGAELLKLIRSYTKTWDILVKYDENRLELPTNRLIKSSRILEYQKAKQAINSLKEELIAKNEASELFGLERDKVLEGIIGNVYQTFDGKELYESVEEKSAHLIYFIIKDHPFSDGNKRIGCLLFLLFLNISAIEANVVTPESLTALALLIAESDPMQKDIVIKLVLNLISSNK